jgi:4a-hydroxytetrahydrobiopterin dehydratase
MASTTITASDLREKRCQGCEGGSALSSVQAGLLLSALDGWQSSGKEISKTYKFKNYYETMAFVNGLAFVAHRENHHPDLMVTYNKCEVRYSSHEVGGLSENDFICAAKADGLLA